MRKSNRVSSLRRGLGVLSLAIMATPAVALAQSWEWTGAANNNFNNAGNWTPATVPASANDTTLTFAGATNITVNNDFGGPFTLTEMTVNATGSTVDISGGTFNFTSNSGTNVPFGVLTQAGSATINFSSEVTFDGNFGVQGAGTGAVNFTGPINGTTTTSRFITTGGFTTTVSGAVTVGGVTQQSGTLVVDGSTISLTNSAATNTYSFVIGTTTAAAAGTTLKNLAGMSLVGAGMAIGRNGASGTLTVESGATVLGIGIDAGIEDGSSGTINVTGGDSLVRVATLAGGFGNGSTTTVNVSDGGVIDIGDITVLADPFGAGTSSFSSTAVVNVTNGGRFTGPGDFTGATTAGSVLTVNVDGPTSRFDVLGAYYPAGGYSTNSVHGTSITTVTGGATFAAGSASIADGDGGRGTFTATGSTVSWGGTSYIAIGTGASAVANITDSAFTANALFVGAGVNASGTLTVTNSVVTLTSALIAGGSSGGVGSITFSGSPVTASNNLWTTFDSNNAGSVRFVNSGTSSFAGFIYPGGYGTNSTSGLTLDNSALTYNTGQFSTARFGGGNTTSNVNLINGGVISSTSNTGIMFLAMAPTTTTNISVSGTGSTILIPNSSLAQSATGLLNDGSVTNIAVTNNGTISVGSVSIATGALHSGTTLISSGGRLLGARNLLSTSAVVSGSVLIGGNSQVTSTSTPVYNVTVTGTGSLLESTNQLRFGVAGTSPAIQNIQVDAGGVLRSRVVTIGTNVSLGDIFLGEAVNNVTNANITGAGSQINAQGGVLVVGSSGTGNLTLSSGAVASAAQFSIATGTNLTSSANVVVNSGATVTAAQSGTIAPSIFLGTRGTITMSGGTVTVGGLSRSGTAAQAGSIVLNSGAITLTGRTGGTSTYIGSSFANLSGAGGSITLNDPTNFLYQEFVNTASTYSGPFNVVRGTLGVVGTNAIGGTGTVTLGTPGSAVGDRYELALWGGTTLTRSVVANGPSAQSAVISSTAGLSTNAQTSALTGPVTLNQNLTIVPVGTLSITGGISGSGNVSVTGYVGTGFASGTAVLGGALTYAGQTRVIANTLRAVSPLPTNNQLVVSTGASALLDAPASPSLNVLVSDLGLVSVAGTGSVSIPATNLASDKARVAVIQSINLAPTARLDLNNNDAIFRNGDINVLRSLVAQGIAGSTGIDSSVGGGMGGSGVGRDAFATLGLRTPASGFGFLDFSSFDGIAVSATDVVAKYTYYGDTDLNGFLDARDYNKIVNGWSNGLTGWQNGDVNYDGVINATDFNLFMGAYTFAGAPFSDPTNPGGAIPEPAALGLIAAALPLVSRRRRRA